MSKFGWIFIGYIIYLSTLLIGNSISIANDKPVVALGYISQWWFILIVFLTAYASEWLYIILRNHQE